MHHVSSIILPCTCRCTKYTTQHSKLCTLSQISHKQGCESLLMKKSETWIQIQRYVEMMPFLPFGNPWGYRFQRAFANSIQSTREVHQMSSISFFVENNIARFSSPGRHKKSEFSRKSEQSHPCTKIWYFCKDFGHGRNNFEFVLFWLHILAKHD